MAMSDDVEKVVAGLLGLEREVVLNLDRQFQVDGGRFYGPTASRMARPGPARLVQKKNDPPFAFFRLTPFGLLVKERLEATSE